MENRISHILENGIELTFDNNGLSPEILITFHNGIIWKIHCDDMSLASGIFYKASLNEFEKLEYLAKQRLSAWQVLFWLNDSLPLPQLKEKMEFLKRM